MLRQIQSPDRGTWYRLSAGLPAARRLALFRRYATDRLHGGRGAYVDGLCIGTGGSVPFDASRPADAARIEAVGWTASGE